MNWKALSVAAAAVTAAVAVYFVLGLLDSGGPFVSGVMEMEKQPIYAPASGIVKEMPVSAGDIVRRGGLLVRIDPVELRDRIKRAVSEERDALKRSESAAQEYKKLFNLYETKKATKQFLDRAKALADLSYREYLDKKNITDGMTSILKKSAVTSRYDSVVLDAHISAGSAVRKGEHLMTVKFPGRLVLTAKIPQKYSGNIKLYGPVDIAVSGISGNVFRGKVSDLTSFEVTIIVSVPGAKLKPGQKVRAELPLEKKK